ncbi:hypothetical protein GW17_00041796 [Ensete ventricosum]|nr:hypothetical protein GW17_00041796 [Ensete ventricosum]
MATLRNLKIKTATCKRILKELQSYEKEVDREAAKTADMKEKGADPYDLKQQSAVQGSSYRGIPLGMHIRINPIGNWYRWYIGMPPCTMC